MKPSFFAFLLMLSFFATQLTAGDFEGNIIMTSRQIKEDAGEGYETQIRMAVKKDKIALTIPGNPTRMVIDVPTGDLYSVIDRNGQQMVMKMNLRVLGKMGGLAAMSGFGDGFAAEESDAKVVTENTTLKGYNCKKYTVTDSDSETEVWVAQNFPFDFSKLTSLINFNTSWYNSNTAGAGIMPIKGISKNQKTSETYSFDVDVKPGAIESAKFEIPADAMVMDVSQMMEQMMQNSDPEAMKKMFQQMMPPAPAGK